MTAARVSRVVLAALLLAQVGSAQVRQDEPADFAVTGEITAIDTAAKTLTVKGPNDDGGVYQVTDKTTLMSGDATIGLADLRKGWRVVLNGDLQGGKKVATYVEVVDAPN
jgi:hypothetical protein